MEEESDEEGRRGEGKAPSKEERRIKIQRRMRKHIGAKARAQGRPMEGNPTGEGEAEKKEVVGRRLRSRH
jgi:hypothetical protein